MNGSSLAGGALPFTMPEKSPPAAKQQLEAFFADLERELEKVEFFRPEEKRGTMSVNLRNIFLRMQPTQQDIRTLHGVVTAIAQGRKGPARGGVLDASEAQKLREFLAGQGGVPRARRCVAWRGCCAAIRPKRSECLWQALTNDRRFAGLGFKRHMPVGSHIPDLVSFPLDASSRSCRRRRARRPCQPRRKAGLSRRARLPGLRGQRGRGGARRRGGVGAAGGRHCCQIVNDNVGYCGGPLTGRKIICASRWLPHRRARCCVLSRSRFP